MSKIFASIAAATVLALSAPLGTASAGERLEFGIHLGTGGSGIGFYARDHGAPVYHHQRRADRVETRRIDRHERRADRVERRWDRRADRAETRRDRRFDRWDRRADRIDNRRDRRLDRIERRLDRRDARVERRLEGRYLGLRRHEIRRNLAAMGFHGIRIDRDRRGFDVRALRGGHRFALDISRRSGRILDADRRR